VEEIEVPIADAVVREKPALLVCHGIGSCLAIMLYDPRSRVGGLAHVLLPDESFSRMKENPKKFADSAICWLIEETVNQGANRKALKAKIAGGASLFTSIKDPIGKENLIRAKDTLAKERVVLVAEEVGGTRGRSVMFETATGITRVKKLKSAGNLKYSWEEIIL